MFNLLLSPEYLSDKLEAPAKWLTIGLLGALIITCLVAFLVNIFGAKKIIKVSAIAFVLYAVVLGILLLVLEIAKKFDKAYLEENWVSLDVVTHVLIPLLITLSIALIGGILLFVLAKKKSPKFKPFAIAYGLAIAVCLIVSLILIGVHFSNNIQGDGYYTDEETGKLSPIALYVSAAIISVLTIALALFLGRHDKKPFDTHCIALAGICASLSFALSYVKLWDMPAGGSVTLVSLLPIMIFSYIYGTKKGLLVGFLYGVLQAVQDPWLIHPAQFLLDYPIAFSMVCLAGVLTDLNVLNKLPQVKFALSAILAGSMRFVCHVLSGVFAFGAYAEANSYTDFLLYSLGYNSYVFIDVALVVVAGIFLLSSKSFQREINKLSQFQTQV